MILVKPEEKYKDSFLAALDELTIPSEKSAWVYMGDSAPLDIPRKDFKGYVNALLERESRPPAGFVCDTTFWAVEGEEVVGRISIRHELNENLKKLDGHIGYITRLSRRKKGLATEMLRSILLTERARSIGKLLLTCDADNFSSEKTILKNGGEFSQLVTLEGCPSKKHFWIDLMTSVDLSQLRRNLSLTCEQRLEEHQAALNLALELSEAGKNLREKSQ